MFAAIQKFVTYSTSKNFHRFFTHHQRNMSTVKGGKKLFTLSPGISLTTKQAMLRDINTRDEEFTDAIKFIRRKLLDIAGASPDKYTSVLMQGSGTFAIEAVLSTTIPRKAGKILVLENGSYGRLTDMIRILAVDHTLIEFPNDRPIDVNRVEECLKNDVFTNVYMVHCEPGSGVFNSISEVGALIKKYNPDASFFVDAICTFGAVPMDLQESNVHFMVGPTNKCIESVPGFAYVIAQKDRLLNCKGIARSSCLDLVAEYEKLEKSNQFRFTPPTHSILAFKQALIEHETEGGVAARGQRYKTNCEVLRAGMRKMGFKELVNDADNRFIITPYLHPKHPNFNFQEFYGRLNDKDQVIYSGKVASSFSIGTMGHIFQDDIEYLLKCIEDVCNDMGIPLPLSD
ncbi:2-aminoethylphosphonate--pyruvate transaminase-like [Ptychodera flava]|uniref:2-aminoethylphosphonate--pyruvate transaminase-like n=1 Tax=Ptychodera flava TaxID=63121 RepID=UPI003969CF60